MIELGLLTGALAVLAVVMAVLGAALTTGKAVRQVRQRRREKAESVIRPTLLELMATEADPDQSGPDVADVLGSLPWRSWRVLEPMTISFLAKVRGDAHERLVDLLVERGTVGRMIKRLRRPGAVGRANAAEVLGRVGVPQATPALAERLDDRDPDVRRVCAHALAATPTPEVVDRLLASLDGPRALPFGLVATDLLAIGRDVVPAMLRALDSGSPRARSAAAEIVGLLGSPSAAPGLQGALSDPRSAPELRVRAARALGRLGVPSALDVLVDALGPDENPTVRAAAAQALGDLDDPDAVDGLVAAMSATDHEVAAAASAALAALGPEGKQALEAVRVEQPDELPGQYAAAALATVAVSGAGRGSTVAAGA